MTFRGLLYMLLCFQVSAQEPEINIFAEVAKLAKTDTAAAVDLLRQSKGLDPEGIYEAFGDLDAAAHFSLLHEICKDEELANRFVYGWLSLAVIMPTPDDKFNPPPEDFEIEDWFAFLKETQITPLLSATPDDMPPVLVIPALGTVLKLNQFIGGLMMMLAAGNEEDLKTMQGLFEALTEDTTTGSIPKRYHDVLKAMETISKPELSKANESRAPQQASAKIAAMLEEANIPLSVRLGFAGLGEDSRKTRSDETVLLTTQWLIEALEKDIPVSSLRTDEQLKRFLDAHRHPKWEATAVRLLNASGNLNSNNNSSHLWLLGIAATLGDRNQMQNLTATAERSNRTLARDPSFFLFVREGFFDLAKQQITLRNRELLLAWQNNFLSNGTTFSDVLFDNELEEKTETFIITITNSDVRFITELHFKLLPDHPNFPPSKSRADRVAEMALRLREQKFRDSTAKFTAFCMIGNFPEGVSKIPQTYLDYLQFDRVDKNLNDFAQGEVWARLAAHTFDGIVAAKKYDDAALILRKINESTSRLESDFHRDVHNDVWEEIADSFTKRLAAEDSPPQLLSLARTLTGLPRKHYSPTGNYRLGLLIKKTIRKHSDHGNLKEWQHWYASLPPAIRQSHDLTFINHILRKDTATVSIGGWQDEPIPEPEPEIKPYLELVSTFRNVPHDQPPPARTAAAISASRPVTPAAIAIFHNYRYLSAEEILENANQLAAAFPEENSRKWTDLARVADDAGKKNLAKQFREKAMQSSK